MGTYRGRMTDQDRIIAAARKRAAAEEAVFERQGERDELAFSIMAVADHLRQDKHLDARRTHRLEIEFEDNGNATAVVHSRVFPTYRHVVPASAIEEFIHGDGDESDEDPEDGNGERDGSV